MVKKYKRIVRVELNNIENAKVERLKHKFKVNSKESAIKKAIMEVNEDE